MANRSNTFKIVTAHVSKATVDAATSIGSWAKQSDQPVFTWKAPNSERSIWAVRTREMFLNQKYKTNGGLHGQFVFDWWSMGMYTYWKTNYWASGVQSKEATYLWVDIAGTAQYVQCTIHLPTQDDSTLVVVPGGFKDIIIKISDGTDIT